ncbi:DUF1304 domain-containing protein [Alteromonas flava]|uniref:DUF1304 domain-containing protein n=1 Tax=Alteromonas flava TaxID=2048003 RepID=UPI000C28A70D|nr:DUF1304 domain-containing protein [Alteromonas flava]
MWWISRILIATAGIFHVGFFALESVFFMSESIYKLFGAESLEQAKTMQNFAFNQGFYNLFLAVGVLGGLLFESKWKENVGLSIAVFSSLSMIAAGLVLYFSTGKIVGASVQAGIPMLGLLFLYFSRSK